MAIEKVPEREPALQLPPLRAGVDGEIVIAGIRYKVLSESCGPYVTKGGQVNGISFICAVPL